MRVAMVNPRTGVDAVGEASYLLTEYGALVVIAALFLLIVGISAYLRFKNEQARFEQEAKERAADRNMERQEREKDREARDRLDEIRIAREDDTTRYMRELLERFAGAVETANISSKKTTEVGERLERALEKTHDVHDDLSERVEFIVGEISNLRKHIAENAGKSAKEAEQIMLALTRMESAFQKIMVEITEEKEE